jgi:hypothetical protein
MSPLFGQTVKTVLVAKNIWLRGKFFFLSAQKLTGRFSLEKT